MHISLWYVVLVCHQYDVCKNYIGSVCVGGYGGLSEIGLCVFLLTLFIPMWDIGHKLFIVDSMTVGYPAESCHFYDQPQPGGPGWWISGVLSLDVLSSKTTAHLPDCCVDWISS